MKTILPKLFMAVLLCLLWSFNARAQSYLTDSSSWMNVYEYFPQGLTPPFNPPTTNAYILYFVNGQDTVNNLVYKKIYTSTKTCSYAYYMNYYNMCQAPPSPSVLATRIREQAQRWYILTANGQDSLLYRFDLAQGDSVLVAPSVYSRVDTVINNYNNSGSKFFVIKDQYGNSGGLIEGVGPTSGFLAAINFMVFEGEFKLYCSGCSWFRAVGIDELRESKSDVVIYPNPASTQFNIKLPAYFGNAKLNVMDALGRSVLQLQFAGSEQSLDISTWPKGLYLLEASDGTYKATHKFVKE